MTYPAIEQLLAHRPPMRLLSSVLSHSAEETQCLAVLRSDCVFLQDSTIPAATALELMAQAAAASVALRAHSPEQPPRMGVLVSVRAFELTTPALPLNQDLAVSAKVLFFDGKTGQFQCEVRAGETSLSCAQLTVHEPEPTRLERLGGAGER